MTISELIKQLEAFKEKHGDVQVTVNDDQGAYVATSLDLREYHDGGTREWQNSALLS